MSPNEERPRLTLVQGGASVRRPEPGKQEASGAGRKLTRSDRATNPDLAALWDKINEASYQMFAAQREAEKLRKLLVVEKATMEHWSSEALGEEADKITTGEGKKWSAGRVLAVARARLEGLYQSIRARISETEARIKAADERIETNQRERDRLEAELKNF